VRWQERPAAANLPTPPSAAAAEPELSLDGYRSLWDAPEVEFSPALQFLYRRLAQAQAATGGGR